MKHYDISVNSDGVRRDDLDGREHLVVPVKAVEEGVLDGGLLPAEIIKESEPGWNGVPAVAGHPTDGQNFVSANQPQVHDNLSFGKFFDADATDGEMTGELWLNVEKADALADDGFEVAKNAIEKLDNGEDVALSTSYIPTERTEDPGHYDGQAYQHVLESIQPDHIGVLPEGRGRDPNARTLVANSMRSITNTLGTVLSHATPDTSDRTVRVNIRENQYVKWDWSDGTAYGQVTEIIDGGSRTIDGNTREVSSGDGERIAVIDQYSEDGEPQNQQVLKYIREDGENENGLTGWDAPEKARANEAQKPMADLSLSDDVAPFLADAMGLPEDDVAAFVTAMNPDAESDIESIAGAIEASDAVETDALADAMGVTANEDTEANAEADGDGAAEGETAANQGTDFSARVAANRRQNDSESSPDYGSYSTRRTDN
jgi:hypothetical protein